MNDRGLLDLIISLLPDVRLTEKICLLNAFDHENDLFVQSKRDIEEILKRELRQFWDIGEIQDKAGRIDTICKMRSIKWVSWTSGDYPPLLREMYDPPSVIFFRGNLPDTEKPLLGMVGTRNPSPAASNQAYKIAYDIGKAGISVVSGLALGIDAMSHRGNLGAGVPGYAVLGSGIDEVYPSANRDLAKRILDSGGALISEYCPGVRPGKWTFPARNRIIAALSRSVLIVEAPKKSGALITAGFALDQGKDLWVAYLSVPETEKGKFDREGTVKLANDGAEIIFSAFDVLEKWNIKIAANNDKKINEDCESGRRELISSMASFLKIEI
jgi:DNA processing protein